MLLVKFINQMFVCLYLLLVLYTWQSLDTVFDTDIPAVVTMWKYCIPLHIFLFL